MCLRSNPSMINGRKFNNFSNKKNFRNFEKLFSSLDRKDRKAIKKLNFYRSLSLWETNKNVNLSDFELFMNYLLSNKIKLHSLFQFLEISSFRY